MKIATFNANSVRARLPVIVEWLSRHKPDVLCLQETKVEDDGFPKPDFESIGYHATYRGEKSYNGVALLSREPPAEHSFGFDDGEGPADETRLVYARFGPVRIVNTYVPQGREILHPMYQYKLQWLGRLRRYFERRFSPRAKVLWAGDMNVAPEAQDIHNAEQQAQHVCFHVDVRQAFAHAVGWGFEDVFRKHHPQGGYTFFDYRTPNAAKRNLGWRIDHLLATRCLGRRCVSAEIDLEPRLGPRPSDHTFLMAEFDLD